MPHARTASPAILLVAVLVSTPASAQQRPFEQVVERLKSPEAAERLAALRLLAESGYPEAALPVAPLLGDPDARIRREALSAELGFFLGSSAASRAFDANWASMPAPRVPAEVVVGLLPALADPAPARRIEAAYAIGLLGQVDGVAPDLGHKAVVEALADRMGDPDPSVRLAVARAAGRVFRRCPAGCSILAIDRVGDALVRLLNDPDPAVQGAGMEGLGELRYERAVKALTDRFGHFRDGEMAYGALDTLARIGHASSAGLFRTALASRDANFRRAAVEGLARAADKDAAAALDQLGATERDPAVALALTFAQQRSGRAQVAGRLVQALGDKRLGPQAQDYLIELGPATADDLAAALPEAQPDARIAILEALGVVGGARQVSAIESLRGDRDRRVAQAARRALARIGAKGPA